MTKSKRPQVPKTARPKWLLPATLVGIGVVVMGIILLLIQTSQRQPYTPEVAGSPRLKVDREAVDYGNVKFDTPIETVFRVSNVGDKPLVILGEPQVELVRGC